MAVILLLWAFAMGSVEGTTADAALASQPQRPAALHPTTSSPAPTIPTGTATKRDRGPREALTLYLQHIDDGDFAAAARYLALPPGYETRGPQLAMRLGAVLRRFGSLDLSEVSPRVAGNRNDGLPLNLEVVATVSDGRRLSREAVRMERRPGEPKWLIASETVEAIDRWYGHLGHSWFTKRLPLSLWRPGPWGVPWWQWLAWPLLLTVAWGVGVILGRATRMLLTKFGRHTHTAWDDELLPRMKGPITLLWCMGLTHLLLPVVALQNQVEELMRSVVRIGVIVAIFWAVARAIDTAQELASRAAWAKRHHASRSLMPLVARIGNVLVWVVALLVFLSELGFSVTSLVAGLGLGGLALALAAQKTVENLFGAFSISIDEPFREGDFVRVDGVTGTVEEIGLRSTKIRTPERTLVNMPNGKLADMRLESISARDRFRLKCVVGLTHATTAEQMKTILHEMEIMLLNHPKIWPNEVTVQFTDLASGALNIEVGAWFQTTDAIEFSKIRQEILLGFMRVIEHGGASLAAPGPALPVIGPTPSRL